MENKRILFSLIVVAVLLFAASRVVDLNETWNVLIKADLGLLLLAVLFEVISLGLKTLRWDILLKEVNSKVNFFELFKIQVAGTAISNLTPARIGETSKSLYLEKHGLKKRFTLLTILWERLLDFFAIIIFSTLIVSSYGGLMLLALAFVAVLALITYHIDKLVKLVSRIKRLSFLGEFAMHKFSKSTLSKSFFVTLFAWFFDFLAIAIAFHAAGVKLNIIQIIGASAISLVVGILSTIPGGLGSMEATLYLLLNGTSTPYPIAVFAAAFLAARIVTIGVIFIIGAVAAMTLKKQS